MVVHRKLVCDLFLSPLPVNHSHHRLGTAIFYSCTPTHSQGSADNRPSPREKNQVRSGRPRTQRIKRQKEEGRWREKNPQKTGSSKPGRKKSGRTGFILQASLCLATTELGINRSEPFTNCTHHTQHPCRPQTASSSQ